MLLHVDYIAARLPASVSVRALAQAQEGLLRAERWEARGQAVDRLLGQIEAYYRDHCRD